MTDVALTRWPKAHGKDSLRNVGRNHVVTFCGVNGCRRRFSGPHERSQARLAAHRAEFHPDWRPPKSKRRKKTPPREVRLDD